MKRTSVGQFQLLVFAGTTAARNAAKSHQSYLAVRAFRRDLELDFCKCGDGAVTVEEHGMAFVGDAIRSRLVLTATDLEPLEQVLSHIQCGTVLPLYWRPNVSAVLMVDDSQVEFLVNAQATEAARAATICAGLEMVADGHMLVKNTSNPSMPLYIYNGIAESQQVLRVANRLFDGAVPNPQLQVIGRSVLAGGNIELIVELANRNGAQAQLEARLAEAGIVEDMITALKNEDPKWYVRRSHLERGRSRRGTVATVRQLVADLRIDTGSINRAWVDRVSV